MTCIKQGAITVKGTYSQGRGVGLWYGGGVQTTQVMSDIGSATKK